MIIAQGMLYNIHFFTSQKDGNQKLYMNFLLNYLIAKGSFIKSKSLVKTTKCKMAEEKLYEIISMVIKTE